MITFFDVTFGNISVSEIRNETDCTLGDKSIFRHEKMKFAADHYPSLACGLR